MLQHPTVHPAGLRLAGARAAFEESPKTHLLLLVRGGVLVTTLDRDDLAVDAEPTAAAAAYGLLDGRTVGPDVEVAPLRASMAGSGRRRLAVVDEEMQLLGLLCLKQSLDGFCTDEAVDAMRSARRR